MKRIKLEFPKTFKFFTEVSVRITDVNYAGHLGNDSVLSLVHEAREKYLNHFGFSEGNVDGKGIIMIDAAIVYKSEAFHGDNLKIYVIATDINRNGCDYYYKLVNADTGKDVAHAKTGTMFFDFNSRKLVSTPVVFKLKIEGEK